MKWMFKNTIQNKFQNVIDKYAGRTVLVTLLVTLFFISLIPNLKIENEPEKFGLPSDDEVKISRDHFESQFNPGAMILIGLKFEKPINWDDIIKIKTLSERLVEIDGIFSVKSILDATEFRWIKNFRINILSSRPFISLKKTSDSEYLSKVIDRLADNSIYKKILISEDKYSTVLILSIDPEVKQQIIRLKSLIEEIKSVLEKNNIDKNQVHLAGVPILNTALQNAMRRDLLIFAPACITICLLVLILVFRQWRPVLSGIITAIISLIWTIGMLPLTKTPMSLNLTMIVPVILSLSMIYSIHYLAGIFIQKSNDMRGDVILCWRQKITPAILCAFTTCLGFLALISSRLIGIREVGVYIGMGVIISMLISNFFLPAMLRLLNWSGSTDIIFKETSFIEKVCYKIKDSVLNHSALFVIIMLLITFAVGFGALSLQTETNHLKYLAKNRELTKSFHFVDSSLGGILPLEIIVETENEKAPNAINDILTFENILRNNSKIGFVISPADFIQMMETAKDNIRGPLKPFLYLDKNIISKSIWDKVEGVPGYGNFLIRNDSMATIRISSRVRLLGSSELRTLVDSVKALANKYLSDYNVIVTGSTPYFSRVEYYVVTTQIVSFSLALIVIIITLGLLSGSFRLGVIVMTVNLIPVIIIIGVMGWLKIPLDVSTVMIASITLGIVVDDTIHLVYRFRKAQDRSDNVFNSLKDAFEHVGLPVIVTTIILFFSFSTLLLGQFLPTVYFGGLAALTILIAWVADLLLLPALIRLLLSNKKIKN